MKNIVKPGRPSYEDLENQISELNKHIETLESSRKADEVTDPDFRKMFEEAPLSYQSLDSEGRFLMVNEIWLKMLGYTSNEVIGKWFGDFLAPEYVEPFKKRFPQFKARGEIQTEFEMLHKNGDRRHVAFEGRISSTQNGDFIRTHCILENITERKKIENLLQSSKEELKMLNTITSEMLQQPDLKSLYKYIAESLSNILSDTITLFISIDEKRKETRIEAFSGINKNILKEIKKITGYKLIGKTFKLTPNYIAYFKSGHLVEFKGGMVEFSNPEFPSLPARVIEKLINLNKIYSIGINKGDRLLSAIHFFTFNKGEITKQRFIESFAKHAGLVLQKKIAETSLIESEIRFKALHNASLGGIAIHDRGKILECNQGLSVMTGYLYEELVGMDGLLLIAERSRKLVMKKILSGNEKPYEATGIRKNGEEYPMLLEARNVPFKGKKARTVEIRDITQQKKAEIEILKAKERAEESDRLKSAFLANMSHEIRTPMNGILGFAELLKTPDLTGEEQQQYISIIQSSGARMLNIINDIVSISKIESGLMEVSINKESVNDILEYIYTFFMPEISKKGLKFSFNKPLSYRDVYIQTDREKVYAILTNLVKNSIKYTERGSIDFGCDKKNGFLEFYVKDTGIGVKRDRQKAIFERFIQADVKDVNAYEGAGLGLSISKAYVEMLGGEIWVDSKLGKGSNFFFTLPYEDVQLNEAIEMTNNASPEGGRSIRKLKILIAEDDEISAAFLTRAVQQFGEEIVKVNTGKDAVAACQKHSDIDLVLMDIRMPGIDGYEATRQIRKFNKEVVIIAQTAYALLGDKAKALAAGCDDYLSKPVLAHELENKIKNHFGS